MKLRILIADDEPLARARLGTLVRELGHVVCAEAGDGVATEQVLQHARPDVVLLDIEMPGRDGISLARHIRDHYPDTSAVLVTAHAEYAVAAFDADACDYVLKPVRPERLARALERVAERRHASASLAPVLRLTIGRKERLIHLDEIDCFVAEDGYVVARSAVIQGFVAEPLGQLEQRFGPALLRIHRSCLAVKAAIAGIETSPLGHHRILFRDDLEPALISRRHLPMVREFMAESAPPTPDE